MRNNKILAVVFWIFTVAIMTAVFMFSSQSGEESSETSGGFIRLLLETFYPNFEALTEEVKISINESFQHLVRKTAHFSVYFALGVCSCEAFRNTFYNLKRSINCIFAAILCFCYAISDELHQLFVSERSGQITDVLLDFAGSVCGILVVSLIVILIISRKRKSSDKNISRIAE